MNGVSSSRNRRAGGDVAGAGARLDQRGALPVLADALVVAERRRHRHRDLRGGGIGTQPQIDAEHVTVGSPLLQDLDQAPGQPDEERRRLHLLPETRGRAVVEDDEVDVARIVELEGAHLAHGEDRVARAVARPGEIARRQPAVGGGTTEQEIDRRANGGVGEVGQRPRDPHHRPDLADVGERNHERRLGLEAAQQMHHLRLLDRRRDRGPCRGEQAGKMGVRIRLQQTKQALRLAARKIPQERRALGDRRDEHPDAGDARYDVPHAIARSAGRQIGEPSGDTAARRGRDLRPRRNGEPPRQRAVIEIGAVGGRSRRWLW